MAHTTKTQNGVRDIQKEGNDGVEVCSVHLCNAMSNLRLCGQCKIARYCCKEHQKLDWKRHKVQCMKDKQPGPVSGTLLNDDQARVLLEAASSNDTTAARPKVHFSLGDSSEFETQSNGRTVDTTNDQSLVKEIERKESTSSMNSASSSSSLSTSRSSSSVSSSSSTASVNQSFQTASLDEVPEDPNQSPSDLQSQIQKDSALFRERLGSGYPLKPNKDFGKTPMPGGSQEMGNRGGILNTLVKRVVNSLTERGIFVLDKFLEESRGLAILKEVQDMHSSGQFQDGQVVRSRSDDSSKIRGDQITWRNGDEPDCTNLRYLISFLDSILAMCNGKLEDYNINGRTKAMIACYPGNGTHYVRHVDNPNNDGRCITCIYYLNRNWDVSVVSLESVTLNRSAL
ncbi:egl nine homolog 1-like isoform X2 [Antedon mediterranea]|uniref:egl nine homolog 1-like isoform X2 n=1 Tax=Antedon mediterranea TaxID=105859 RepID=UPI003AF62048